MDRATVRPGDADRRLERAHTILDAAGELVLRWGYDKTTIGDIAQAAGVAKGTIYLHWSTRDELFGALLRRERVLLLTEVRARFENGPTTLRDLLRDAAAELTRRPLTRAALLGDSEVLGKLGRRKQGSEASDKLRASLESYVRTLMEHGALRQDLSPAEHVNVVAAVFYGFHRVPELTLGASRFSDERMPDLLADTVHRALGADPARVEDPQAVSAATQEYLDLAVATAQENQNPATSAGNSRARPDPGALGTSP